jgi:glycosyltransferase involved in cell wall biosynthesis
MRILHISTRLILGGSQENTLLSCEGQARLGHEVHLAYGPIYGPEGSMLQRVQDFNDRCRNGEEIRTDGGGVAPILTHEVESLIREVDPQKDRACLRSLESLVREVRPDIVHTHSSKAGILGRLAAWRAGSRGRAGNDSRRAGAEHGRILPGIVHTIHGPPFMPVEGSAFKRTRRLLTNFVYTVAERRAAHKCDVIVSVADAMTREFLHRGIGRPEQYVTVYSGMETARFLSGPARDSREAVRRELGIGDADFVIGTVARLAEHKGHDDILEALGATLKATPGMKLLWVGDGWWRERLLSKARALGLVVREMNLGGSGAGDDGMAGAQVILTGLVPPDEVARHIRAMDVLAHPSYREGLPRTVPQALLCGVCPVAYDVDGTGEICREMETGRLVPRGDRERLREAIVWCMQHHDDRIAMAARGRAECVEKFSADRMVTELEAVYARASAIARGR